MLEACRLRLRPILMTCIAFIMGVYPLASSRGAGFEKRRAKGVAVFAGMIGVACFGLLLTPVFFTTLRKLSKAKTPNTHHEEPLQDVAAPAPAK